MNNFDLLVSRSSQDEYSSLEEMDAEPAGGNLCEELDKVCSIFIDERPNQ